VRSPPSTTQVCLFPHDPNAKAEKNLVCAATYFRSTFHGTDQRHLSTTLLAWTRTVNAVNFFICGLPGGLDYFLLSLVKLGLIDKIVEKRANLWLQVPLLET
jgi:hypothetical protein